VSQASSDTARPSFRAPVVEHAFGAKVARCGPGRGAPRKHRTRSLGQPAFQFRRPGASLLWRRARGDSAHVLTYTLGSRLSRAGTAPTAETGRHEQDRERREERNLRPDEPTTQADSSNHREDGPQSVDDA